MKKYILLTVFLMIPQMVFASPVRVHCQPNGILFENITTDELEEEYEPIANEDIVIIDESEIPAYQYPEQLSCQNGKLLYDPNFKPQYAIELEQRKEQLVQAQAVLDAELGKAEPDVIAVLRLQRAIEKIKKGE